MDQWIEIGTIQKPHGLGGQFKVLIDDQFLPHLSSYKAFFLEQNGSMLPYFPEAIKGEHETILKLEEIDTREQVMALKGAGLFVSAKDLENLAGTTSFASNPYERFEGGVLSDEEMGEIGTILEIIAMPQQLMAVVDYQEKEVLIPLHEDLVVEMDEAQKKIICRLPEGILAL